jgi:hypothetical protein
MRNRKDEVQNCSKCGEPGHRASTCGRTTKVCKGCKQELPLSEFATTSNKNRAGARHIWPRSLCRQCNSLQQKIWYKSSLHTRFLCLLAGARRRKPLNFSLTIEDLEGQYKKQSGLCYYSHKPLSLETGKDSISLDRIDPNGSYNKDNIVLVCWIINWMKADQTTEEFVIRCKQVVESC